MKQPGICVYGVTLVGESACLEGRGAAKEISELRNGGGCWRCYREQRT